MADHPTCGEGLAEHAVLPAKLAELLDSLADNLEVHMEALDLTDDASRQEHAAYLELVGQHRRLADRLRSTSEEMAAYRDLPMGRHDPVAMRSPRVADAFERFLSVQRELAALLTQRVQSGEAMLGEMSEASEG